ncbi:MAG: hypothetical protein QM776_05035 [Rhodocyclaceae bacterium]
MKALWLCLACLTMLASPAIANGGLWENPLRATGDALINSTRFTLQREELSIQLKDSWYALQVRYHTQDKGASATSRTVMYFPVICHKLSEQERKTGRCVHSFKVAANGRALESLALAPDLIEQSPKLWALGERLKSRLHSTWANDFEDGADVVFFKIVIPDAERVQTIDIAYEAKYSQEAEGVSSRADEFYSPARVVYDFSPAAQWAGDAVSELTLRIDTSGMLSPLKFDARQWPFSLRGETGELTIRKPDFSRLPPLVLSTDNDGYMNFKAFMETLKRGRTTYQVAVHHAKPSRAPQGRDVRALFDRDPHTYWCWRGPSAQLKLSFAPGLVYQHQADFQIMRLVGAGILNGAVRSPEDFDRYGLAKTIGIRLEEGASDEDERPVASLPRLRMRSARDHFRTNSLIELGYFPDDGSINNAEEADRYRKTTAPLQFILEIKGVHRRKGSDENCLSEVYPVYLY